MNFWANFESHEFAGKFPFWGNEAIRYFVVHAQAALLAFLAGVRMFHTRWHRYAWLPLTVSLGLWIRLRFG